MRCFLAVDVPEDIKEKLFALQQELKDLDTKLVERENLHFTLKFLGELDEEHVKQAVNKISALAAGFSGPFTVLLKGVGFFPSRNFIRVAWVGAQSQKFLDLHVAVNELLSDVVPAEKPVPHLTLARVRSQAHKKELHEFGTRHVDEEFGSFDVTEIKLKKSNVLRTGPVYEDVCVWKLAGGAE